MHDSNNNIMITILKSKPLKRMRAPWRYQNEIRFQWKLGIFVITF